MRNIEKLILHKNLFFEMIDYEKNRYYNKPKNKKWNESSFVFDVMDCIGINIFTFFKVSKSNLNKKNVVYQLGDFYIGKTNRKLIIRICEHLTECILLLENGRKRRNDTNVALYIEMIKVINNNDTIPVKIISNDSNDESKILKENVNNKRLTNRQFY